MSTIDKDALKPTVLDCEEWALAPIYVDSRTGPRPTCTCRLDEVLREIDEEKKP